MSKEHGFGCDCRTCCDYWDKDHSEIKQDAPPPQPASEGPYYLKEPHEFNNSVHSRIGIYGPDGELNVHYSATYEMGEAKGECSRLNAAHATGKVETAAKYAKLVEAAKKAHALMIVGLLCEKGSPIESALRAILATIPPKGTT